MLMAKQHECLEDLLHELRWRQELESERKLLFGSKSEGKESRPNKNPPEIAVATFLPQLKTRRADSSALIATDVRTM